MIEQVVHLYICTTEIRLPQTPNLYYSVSVSAEALFSSKVGKRVNCIYNETTGGNYYEAYKVTLSYKTFNNGATGITFYYNGVTYTGFVR